MLKYPSLLIKFLESVKLYLNHFLCTTNLKILDNSKLDEKDILNLNYAFRNLCMATVGGATYGII